MGVHLKSPIQVLIADDDRDFRNALEMVLASEGYSICAVQDGAEAIEVLDKNPIPVVILDIMMPKVSGLDVLRHVKQHFPGTEAIILSGYLGESLRGECERLGAAHILTKPYDVSELVGIVNLLQDHATVA